MNFKEMWYEALLVLLLMVYSVRIYIGLQSRRKRKLGSDSNPELQSNVPQSAALESERYRLRSRLHEFNETIPGLEREIARLTTVVEESVEARQLHWLKIDDKHAILDRLRRDQNITKEILSHM